MEKASATSLSLAEPVGLLLLHIVPNCVFTLQKFCLRFLSFRLTCEQPMRNMEAKSVEDIRMRREDLEMVMGRMGLRCSQEGEQLREYMGLDELAAMFDDKEPSLQEVKEAFCVFDENHDGSIDAVELQSVLSKLGFREGLALNACQEMIAVYDENRDGMIDFNEFVKFMESSFC